MVCPVLSSAILSGCVSRTEVQKRIDATVFLHDQIPVEICRDVPQLKKLGIYRKLNNGQEEFVSYCKPEIELYFGLYEKDVQKILDEFIPKKK